MKCGLPPTHQQRVLPSAIGRNRLVTICLRVIHVKLHQLADDYFDGAHGWHKGTVLPQDAQKVVQQGRSE
ncbi:MAG: hypothetical protein ABI988_09750 [Nitrospirota bacterium]